MRVPIQRLGLGFCDARNGAVSPFLLSSPACSAGLTGRSEGFRRRRGEIYISVLYVQMQFYGTLMLEMLLLWMVTLLAIKSCLCCIVTWERRWLSVNYKESRVCAFTEMKFCDGVMLEMALSLSLFLSSLLKLASCFWCFDRRVDG